VIVQANSDIASGECPDNRPTLPDNNPDQVCTSPATRIFVALSEALGYPFPPEIEAWLHGATG
jgi:D-alanyl-D-alanine carboxypeptidase